MWCKITINVWNLLISVHKVCLGLWALILEDLREKLKILKRVFQANDLDLKLLEATKYSPG